MNDEHENCGCFNCNDEGYNNEEQINVIKNNQREYFVTTCYLKSDVENTFFSSKVINTDESIIISHYKVHAIDISNAIQQALEIDKYRKMMILSTFYKILGEKQDKHEFTYESVADFHEFMVKHKAFQDLYLSEPTSIQAVLVKNVELVEGVAQSDKNNKSMADDVEEWLKNNDN